MIQLKNISKSYTSHGETITLFDWLDWKVEAGSFVAIMGPSGAGKSTLLSLIAGLSRPDNGEVFLWKTDITQLDTDAMIGYRGEHIAFIFQAFELVPNLTVEENIDLIIDIAHTKRRFTTEEILEKVGLGGKWKRYPTELSGWEQQRVAIARAFVSDVPFLLADEPTWNLDEGNARKIMDLIDVLHRETGNTIVMITHDGGIASRSDMIYRLAWGTLTQESA
jgi:putative ABC transport system ATP-binding protein